MKTEVHMALIAAFSYQAMAATSSRAAIGLNLSVYNSDYTSDYSQSVIFEENTNYEPCLCDLTQGTCNAFCCCDTDCSFGTRADWAEKKQCANFDYGSAANGLSLSDCITRKELYDYNRK